MRLDKATYKQMAIRHYAFLIIPAAISIYLGLKLDDYEANRMSRFRDKSALYGRILAPGEPPSWP